MQNACLSLKWHWFGAHIFSVGGLLLTLFVALLSGPRHWYCPQQQSATDANFSRKFYFNTIFLSNIKEKKLFQMGTFWVKKNAFKCYDHKINLWLCNLMPKERECGMSIFSGVGWSRTTVLQVYAGKSSESDISLMPLARVLNNHLMNYKYSWIYTAGVEFFMNPWS